MKPTAKKTLAEAIAARKAARIPTSPTTLSPQTLIDRRNIMTKDVARLVGCACGLRVLGDMLERVRPPDLDALAGAIDDLEEAIKGARTGMR